MSPAATLIVALLLTLIIEIPIGALIINSKSAIIPLFLINLLTNPAINVILMILFSLTESYAVYLTALIIGEIAVFVGEGILIRILCDIPQRESMVITIVTNSASLVLGSSLLALF